MEDKILVTYEIGTGKAVESLNTIQKELIETDAAGKKAFTNIGTSTGTAAVGIDKVAQSVAKAKSGFNGLGNSINQISRELPNFAMNAQIGFLAISNNLPILADAIANVRRENELLAAQGKSTIPVWKQIASSVLGFQTVMTIGITILTLYGAKIVSFIGDLIKGNSSLSETKVKIEAINEAFASKEVSKGISQFLKLQENIKAAKDGILDKSIVLKEYNDTIGRTVGFAKDLNEADSLLVSNKQQYIKAIVERTAAMKLLDEVGTLMAEKAKEEASLLEKAKTDDDIKIIRKQFGEKAATEAVFFENRTKLREMQIEIDKKLKVASDLYQPNIEQPSPDKNKKVEDALVSLYKRQKALLEAKGLDTFNISKKILERELSLLEDGGKEYLDKQNEIYVLIAARDKKAADERAKRLEDENKARIASEQILLEIETKKAANKLDSIRKQNAEEIKLAEDKITKIQKDEKDAMDAELRDSQTTFKRQRALIKSEYEKQYITKAAFTQANKELDYKEKDARLQTLSEVSNALSSIGTLLSSNAEDQKAFAIAGATIDTFVAASRTFASLAANPILAGIATTAVIIGGLARVAQIQAVQLPTPVTTPNSGQGARGTGQGAGFATGVIDLSGPGTSTSDSINARLSKGESVITAKATRSKKDELIALNYSVIDYDRLIQDKYVRPAIEAEKRKQESFVNNMATAIHLHNSMDSKVIVKAIKSNKPATSKDIKILADVVTRTSRKEDFIKRHSI